jgi:hypothetical protein
MNLLVGNTGLIGNTLKDDLKFDYEFNSRNLEELLHLDIDPNEDDLFLCCLPATKWLVNQDPSLDLENIFKILSVISKKSYRNIILYSTIDVYIDAPLESDESYVPKISTLNYGNNRYIFEQLVASTVKHRNLVILRLPALFGKHIKKNIIFDLLNNNQIDKINYNSKYQWYNLEKLVEDTYYCIGISNGFSITNLFSEPINTSDVLKLFKINKSQVDTKNNEITYNFKTNTNKHKYVGNKDIVLKEIEKFIFKYNLLKTKIAVCIFGEERDILKKLEDWKHLNFKLNLDFYVALYSNNNIHDSFKKIEKSLPVKSFFTTNNDLKNFDKVKFKAKSPIYIYGIDQKATFPRILSQLYIRQKSISLVDLNEYDVIMLVRSDISKFNITYEDIHKITVNKDTLIVNSGVHIHPGGGGGCNECTTETKCNNEFHANDICDYWCMGSPEVMNIWNQIYTDALEIYHDIQKLTPKLEDLVDVSYIENLENNEVKLNFTGDTLHLIENYAHCFYPEKLMRVAFKDVKIINATNDNEIWR